MTIIYLYLAFVFAILSTLIYLAFSGPSLAEEKSTKGYYE